MRAKLNAINIMNYLASDNVLIFSQMKSGTTYVCNTLAFYNGLRWNAQNVGFRNLMPGGVFRVNAAWEALDNVIQFTKERPDELRLIHTHNPDISTFGGASYKLSVLLTRSPQDYCVSSFHYFYINREKNQDISRSKVILDLIDRFVKVHKAQQKIADTAKDLHVVRYEELMADDASSLAALITKIYGTCDKAVLLKAIDMASVDSLRNYESKVGKAIVAGRDFTAKHFVRSGKVGEYKDFFSEEEQNMIAKRLKELDYQPL